VRHHHRSSFTSLALALLLAAASHASTNAPKSDPTVGDTLTDLSAQVDKAITAAAAASNAAAMRTGSDLDLAIANAQNVYIDDLGKKADGKLPAALHDTLTQLQKAVSGLTPGTPAALQDATTLSEQIVNALPFRATEPRLVSVKPRFIVPAKDTYPVILHISGTFEFASKADFIPSLAVGVHTYKPTSSNAGEIVFTIPAADLFTTNSLTRKFQFVTGILHVPFEPGGISGKTHILSKKKGRKEALYTIYLESLPSSPGIIKFQTAATRTEMGKPQKATSDAYQQCSSRTCGFGNDFNHSWSAHPDAGCHVIKGSSSFDVIKGSGTWTKKFLTDDADMVVYSVSTTQKAVGGGEVAFHISFMENCPRDVPDAPTLIDLIWGDTKTITATPGWSIGLEGFDSKHYDLTETNLANPYLKVTPGPTGVTITTVDPATVVWP
jgi:hypothetical protein